MLAKVWWPKPQGHEHLRHTGAEKNGARDLKEMPWEVMWV
jgi:hypothetical protein